MKMPKTTVNMLGTVIAEELTKYSEEVADVLKVNTTKIAEECSEEIKSRSPVDKGKYKKGCIKKCRVLRGESPMSTT